METIVFDTLESLKYKLLRNRMLTIYIVNRISCSSDLD